MHEALSNSSNYEATGLSLVTERKKPFSHLKSVPSSENQNGSLFRAGRFCQGGIPTVPRLSATLHVFRVCCEWSPKILPPSINVYCFFLGFWLWEEGTRALSYIPWNMSVSETQSILNTWAAGRRSREERRGLDRKRCEPFFPLTVFTSRRVEFLPSLLRFSIQLQQALQTT